MKVFSKAIIRVVGLGLLLVAGTSLAQEVVSPGDMKGWVNRGSNTGVVGLGIADNHGGTGSLLLSTDGSAGQIVKAARLPIAPFLLIKIADITSISWEFYTDNASNYPRPNLEYFGQGKSGTLVYESGNMTPTVGAWQTASVNIGSDLFRDTASNTIDTLANFQSNPDIGPILMNFFQFGYGSTGGSFPATTTYLDYVELNGTTWDFEDVSTLPPEPAIPTQSVPTMSEWALIMLAMLIAGIVFIRRKQLA